MSESANSRLDEVLRDIVEDIIIEAGNVHEDMGIEELEKLSAKIIVEAIAAILKAFVDDGWAKLADVRGEKLRTGAEWYERFMSEVSIPDENGAVGWNKMLQAAKRAAGIDS